MLPFFVYNFYVTVSSLILTNSIKMDNKIKLIFYGTPDIAARCLQALVEDDSFEVLAVVTQEDKPVGRKQIMTAPPVKVYAEGQGISAHQPEKLWSEDSLFEELYSLGAV